MAKKVFKCDQKNCEKVFSSKFSLKRHYLIHQNKKPYVCDHCQKGFILQQYLEEHKYTHTGDKPFVCGIGGCTDSFRQRGKLSIHRKTHKEAQINDRQNYNDHLDDNEEDKEDYLPYLSNRHAPSQIPQMMAEPDSLQQPNHQPLFGNYESLFTSYNRDYNQNQNQMPTFPSMNNNNPPKPKLDWKGVLKRREQEIFSDRNPIQNQYMGMGQNRKFQNTSFERYPGSPPPEELSDDSPISGQIRNNFQSAQLSNSLQQQQIKQQKILNEKQKGSDFQAIFSNKGNFNSMANQQKFQDPLNRQGQFGRNYPPENIGENISYDEPQISHFGPSSYQQMRASHNQQRLISDQFSQNFNQMRGEVPNFMSQGMNKRNEKINQKQTSIQIKLQNRQPEQEEESYESEGSEEDGYNYDDEEQDSYNNEEESSEAAD